MSWEREPRVWLVATVLAVLVCIVAVVVALRVPSELLAIRVLSGCVLVGGLVGVTLSAAEYLSAVRGWQLGGTERVRRGISLVVGVGSAVALLWSIPWLGDFARPLGAGVALTAQLVAGLFAVLVAVLAVWGFTRRPPQGR